MGNTIKNYQKKRRNESRNAYKELRGVVHNTVMERLGMPKKFLDKEKEIFELLN